MPAGIWYCSLESVKTAISEAETARSNAQIRAAIEQGARDAERLCRRPTFHAMRATIALDYPTRTPSWFLRFPGGWTALELDEVTVDNGATVLSASDYILRSYDDQPPYDKIEIDKGGSASFSAGSTTQRAISLTGLWGVSDVREAVGSLTGTLAASTSATASLAWTTAAFGTGDVLWIDDEAMVIRERSFVDSGQNLGAALDADSAGTTVSVSSGSAFAVEEILLVGGERLRIVDIAGNTLVVERAYDGSQLAAHLIGADIYALTGVELTRAVLGTTLAAHSSSAVVYRAVPPGDVEVLNRAYAINTLFNERSAYARTIQASSDTVTEVTGRTLRKLEDDVKGAWGRYRSGAV